MTGQELKQFRLSLGLKQAEFGRELGFENPQVQISQFENGRRPISKRLESHIRKWKRSLKSDDNSD